MSRSTTFKIIYLLILSRILILIFPLIFKLLITNTQYVNFISFLESSLSFWDAHHYLYLAKYWYTPFGDESNYIVFQPLYPSVIWFLGLFTKNNLIASIITSNLFFILAIIMFYKLLKLDYSDKFSQKVILLFSIFPTAYFFSLPYTESLFAFLTVAALYLIRKNSWLGAGIATGLSILTRHQGLILLPVFLIEYFKSSKKIRLKDILIYLFPPIASVSIYLFINHAVFGDWLAFSKVLANHWYKKPTFFWNGILGSINIARSNFSSFSLMTGFAEALTSIMAWVLVPFAIKKIRASYALYYFLSVLLFTSTGFILSAPRYLLSIPIFFILLAKLIKNKYVLIVWMFLSIALLFYLSLLYVMGQWAF